MLKNGEIIAKLTEEQKLALVADLGSASSESVTALGVPSLEISDVDTLNSEYCGDTAYPPLSSLVNSWNIKLVEQAVGDIVRRDGTEKFGLIATPDVSVKCNAFTSGLSEDAYLNAKFAGACVAAIEASGGTACLDGFGIKNTDIEYLDRTPSQSFIDNVFAHPFYSVLKHRPSAALSVSCARPRGEWKNVNEKAIERATSKNYVNTVICSQSYEEALLTGLTKPELLFRGASVSSLRAALKNYRRMKEDVERGSVTVGELNKALENGTAISDEMLDTAADKVISYINSAVRPREHYGMTAQTEGENPAAAQGKSIALLACEESTVLLKNDNKVLPIVRAAKIATVGELAHSYPDFESAAASVISSRGATYVGHSDGYAIHSERSDELIAGAVGLAKSADVVVVFVGLGNARERRVDESKSIKLPANQTALLSEIAKTGKTVISVVCGTVLPDMKFDSFAQGVLFAPIGGSRGAESLFNIIFGVISPSGRLAFTAFDDADEHYASHKAAVAAGRYKVGEFYGYRRYTTENIKQRYPFGYGLSYTSFEYSNLKIGNDNVEVTVKNVGGRAALEVVQLYIGKKDSAICRPLRVLKGFAKVMIAPNSSVQISFPVNASKLDIYDEQDGNRKVENGTYQVYIGSSASDIRLTGEIVIQGVALNKRSEKLSDYLQSVSNITASGYRMNEVSARGETGADFKSNAKIGDDFEYDKLFADEFGDDDQDDEQNVSRDDDDILNYLDDSVTVKTIAEGFAAFALGKGYKFEASSLYDIIAAMSASRAVLMRCDSETFDVTTSLIGEYFGCSHYIDNAEDYSSSDDLFFCEADTSLTSAIAYASSRKEAVTIAALDGVVANRLSEIFAPFIRYATAPDALTVTFGGGKRVIDVSQNLWFLMRISDGDNGEFPAYLADMATVISPIVTPAAAVPYSGTSPNYYQLVAAFQAAEREYEIDEPLWKLVDKLENYIAARTPFKLDNKMCVQMEKYIAVRLACGAEPVEALDSAVAAKLIPHAVYALDGKLKADDDDFMQTLGNIFGEDETERIRRAAKRKASRGDRK